jgi:hypothetical protein
MNGGKRSRLETSNEFDSTEVIYPQRLSEHLGDRETGRDQLKDSIFEASNFSLHLFETFSFRTNLPYCVLYLVGCGNYATPEGLFEAQYIQVERLREC